MSKRTIAQVLELYEQLEFEAERLERENERLSQEQATIREKLEELYPLVTGIFTFIFNVRKAYRIIKEIIRIVFR